MIAREIEVWKLIRLNVQTVKVKRRLFNLLIDLNESFYYVKLRNIIIF